MIIDSIDQITQYAHLNRAFQAVFDQIGKLDLEGINPGQYEIDGSNAFYYCFEYETKDASLCNGEIHTKMIDVHFIIDGSEIIGVCQRNEAQLTPYDDVNDYSIATAPFKHYMLSTGSFAVFFPHEAHVTAINPGIASARLKKLVFKLPVG